VATMEDVRYTLGVGYLAGSGVTLAAILVASIPGGAGGTAVALLGTVPALGLAFAPVWLPRVHVDGPTVWRAAMWAAVGVGVFALFDVGLLLARLLWPAATGPALPFVAASAGFGGISGALAGCLLGLRRRRRTLTERNAVMRRVLRHDLRTESNLVLGHARAASEATDGAEAHLDAIVESIRRLLDRGKRVRRLQRGAARSGSRRPTRGTAAVVEAAFDAVRERSPGAALDLVAPADPSVLADGSLVSAVADVVERVAGHADGAPVVATVIEPSTTDRTVVVRLRRRDGGTVLPEADLYALDGGSETPLRHGRHTGLWAARWCLERHGGGVAVDRDGVRLELRRARGRAPVRVAARVVAAVRRRLR